MNYNILNVNMFSRNCSEIQTNQYYIFSQCLVIDITLSKTS